MASITAAGPENRRTRLGAVLERVLAEESRLAALTHDYVWRVRGSPLQSLKRLFSEQGRQIDTWLAEIGTQARGFGVPVRGVGPAAEQSPTQTLEQPTAAIGDLLAQHRRLAEDLRVTVDDLAQRQPYAEATNLLQDLREFHETCAWILGIVLASPEPRRVKVR